MQSDLDGPGGPQVDRRRLPIDARSAADVPRITDLDGSAPATLTPGARADRAPSPIRQIMKMAERQNILALGLDPDEVISFGGGWVNHPAPEPLRQAYRRDRRRRGRVPQERRLHGHPRRPRVPAAARALRDASVRRSAPRRGAHRHRRGQHAAHARSLPHAPRSRRHRDADGSDLRQLRGPARLRRAGREDRPAAPDGPRDVDVLADVRSRSRASPTSSALFDDAPPRMVVFGAPDNPTSQILPQSLVEAMRERTADGGAWLAIDFAYKCQYFADAAGLLRLVARRSSARHRHPLELEVGPRTRAPSRLDHGRAGASSTASSASSSAASCARTRCRR